MKRTKIICTIGPSSETPATLQKMIRAGMNVCRLNMSHGTYAWHGRAIRTIRTAAKKTGEPVAILIDLQGPKARIGELVISNLKLVIGQKLVFTTQSNNSITHNPITKIPIAVPNFHKYAKKGAHLLIADGTIECVVEEVRDRDIHAKVTLGGELKSHKGIAIAGVSLPLPSLTSKDKNDAAWARGQDIDFVALSFVKRPADVVALRRLLKKPELHIIVKIETREAVQNFDEILREADGIMIARGDLALATSPEEVPIIQKELIEKCRRMAVPVIVATEMLASMERSPRPSRAEASDVANAVIDHTDATMLSGESASGQFPVEAVATMAHIIKKTEASRFDDLSIGGEITHGPREEEVALLAAVRARTEEAKAILAGSLTGHTGRLLSRYRTEVPLIVGSPDWRVVHQLNLSWGVRPFLVPRVKTMDALLKLLLAQAKKSGLKKRSKIVILGSEKIIPHGQSFVGTRTL
ncbi:pyruvate kinase [Candidatus Uhrbacteria bacterium]|nr:pyruvate kinase [Candidatus Uhrbacteria bacterium]